MSSTRHRLPARRRRKGGSPTPPSADEEVGRSYLAEAGAPALARDAFGALAQRHGASDEQVEEVRLLVSEAVTNAVRHGYPEAVGAIYVMAVASASHLTLLVSDDGIGPRTPSRDPGAGWGWPLIAALCEWFTIRRRSNGGTEVEMHIRIGPDGDEVAHEQRGSDASASLPPTPRFSTTR